jgi:hypothetical protein
MGEVVFVAAILLLLIGAMGFYFYSRMLYNEKKMNLLETILLDIKMMMEMEDNAPPLLPPKKEHVVIGAPEMVQPTEVEELKSEDSGYYADVIESAANEEPVATAVPESSVDYEALNRDELAALAEKRSLRVTKRMNRQTLLTVLRESDKNTSVTQEQVDGSAQLGAPIDGEDIATESAI